MIMLKSWLLLLAFIVLQHLIAKNSSIFNQEPKQKFIVRYLEKLCSIRFDDKNSRGHRMMHGGTGVFAYGEDTHTLRLTSELVDLRVGYANPFLRLRSGTECEQTSCDAKGKKNRPPFWWSVFLWQRNQDSNPDIQSQSLLCYLYTIPLFNFALSFRACILYHSKLRLSIVFLNFFILQAKMKLHRSYSLLTSIRILF